MDISKLHEAHQESFKQLIAMGLPETALEGLYQKLLLLADIPKDDWDKQSTADKIKE